MPAFPGWQGLDRGGALFPSPIFLKNYFFLYSNVENQCRLFQAGRSSGGVRKGALPNLLHTFMKI